MATVTPNCSFSFTSTRSWVVCHPPPRYSNSFPFLQFNTRIGDKLGTKMFRPFIEFRHWMGGVVRRVNYSSIGKLPPELETAFNDQINMEFFASFSYLSMSAHFGRQDVSYPGCHRLFLNQVQEERGHADKIISYLLQRGNCLTLKAIKPPTNQCWKSPLEAFTDALHLEGAVTEKLFQLRKTCEGLDDLFSILFIEDELLQDQLEEYDKMSRHVTELGKIGADSSGVYLYDRHLLREAKK